MSINIVLEETNDYQLLDFQRLGHLFVAATEAFGFKVQRIVHSSSNVEVSDGVELCISMKDVQAPSGKGISPKAAMLLRHIEVMVPKGTFTLQ